MALPVNVNYGTLEKLKYEVRQGFILEEKRGGKTVKSIIESMVKDSIRTVWLRLDGWYLIGKWWSECGPILLSFNSSSVNVLGHNSRDLL